MIDAATCEAALAASPHVADAAAACADIDARCARTASKGPRNLFSALAPTAVLARDQALVRIGGWALATFTHLCNVLGCALCLGL